MWRGHRLSVTPPLLPNLDEWRAQFEEAEIDFVPEAFYGEYGGRRFPQEYNDDEREILSKHLAGAGALELQVKDTRCTLCAAGWLTLSIRADGSVQRCPAGAGQYGGLDFYEHYIPVQDRPTLCPFARCWCRDLWDMHVRDDERVEYLEG
ncbi:MAG TPA: hypothetical protein QGH10_11695 [Armatimonadota bacterium]|nr:hypothetical protein [Armatimonadota bacterium]